MGKVLIVKNNAVDSRIQEFAEKSYNENKKYYYNSNNTIEYVVGNDDIILMIRYDRTNTKKIEELFIGCIQKICDNSIEYIMKVHLTEKEHCRTIQSILDKIDLDVDTDFDDGHYVNISDMESLYEELKERIIRNSPILLSVDENKENVDISESGMCSLAQSDSQCIRIYPSDDVGEYRSEFQRDRERVVNCKAFRRLVDKAQIFSAEKGDYYRTRMTHSLEVNQIAKAISYALNLNLDLTEAIALGHDLGHTPFGHQGERTLDDILCGNINVGIKATREMFDKRCFGGFKHNYQSARILSELEEKYKDFPGLNVSVQVIEGVLKHTELRRPEEINIEDFVSNEYLKFMNISSEENQICSSLEGQVVAVADEIAQRGHDVDDALTSGVMTIDEFMDRLKITKCTELNEKINSEIEAIDKSKRLIVDKNQLKIERIVSCIVNYFIETTIEFSKNNMIKNENIKKITMSNNIHIIDFSVKAEKINMYLKKVVQKKVICNNEVARADYNAAVVVQKLFEKYYYNPRLLHYGTIHKIFIETLRHKNIEVANSAINLNDCSVKLANDEIKEITETDLDEKIVLKHMEKPDYSCKDKNIIMFEKRRILVRAITDYIAGMTDGYALEEYNKLI